MPSGPVQIYRESDRGCVPVATALDLAAVLAESPFGTGRFRLWQGQQSELYVVGRGRAAGD
jgi:hypothetical protein